MAYMFFDATAFNQDLCDFGDNFSQISNNAVNIFMDSGCSNENTPTSATGPWCNLCVVPRRRTKFTVNGGCLFDKLWRVISHGHSALFGIIK